MQKIDLDNMYPRQIVKELDKFIVGQTEAKKLVALVIRNRVRRTRLEDDLQEEVMPKNIILIGSTGVGKTEIARRLSKLSGAPFIKVEATKYTEVGYVGRDVESMVRDLMSSAIALVRQEEQNKLNEEIEERLEEEILNALLPESRPENEIDGSSEIIPTMDPSTREKFRKMLREGKLEDRPIDIDVTQSRSPKIEVISGSPMEEMEMQFGGMFGKQKKRRRVTVRRARNLLGSELLDKLIDQESVIEVAKERAENMGIIFIDEFDKIAHSSEAKQGQDVSREGVQRDILPIVEGSQVNTKYGIIDTSHILFIAAGAFSYNKPSDLIPELQGRFPLRVELEDLSIDDYYHILITPKHSLVKQYVALLKTEKIDITFCDDGVRRLAEIAHEVNSLTENIGARRLHTLMELLLRDVSYEVEEYAEKSVEIDASFVDEKLEDIKEDKDLSRYIL